MRVLAELQPTHNIDNPDPVKVVAIEEHDMRRLADPWIPTPSPVDHDKQSDLAAEVAAMTANLRDLPRDRMQHRRAGITKNKGRKRDKARATMARESRRRNRGR